MLKKKSTKKNDGSAELGSDKSERLPIKKVKTRNMNK